MFTVAVLDGRKPYETLCLGGSGEVGYRSPISKIDQGLQYTPSFSLTCVAVRTLRNYERLTVSAAMQLLLIPCQLFLKRVGRRFADVPMSNGIRSRGLRKARNHMNAWDSRIGFLV